MLMNSAKQKLVWRPTASSNTKVVKCKTTTTTTKDNANSLLWLNVFRPHMTQNYFRVMFGCVERTYKATHADVFLMMAVNDQNDS